MDARLMWCGSDTGNQYEHKAATQTNNTNKQHEQATRTGSRRKQYKYYTTRVLSTITNNTITIDDHEKETRTDNMFASSQ